MQGRHKKWFTAVALAFAFITVTWQASAADEKTAQAQETVSGGGDNVAMVNGTPITRADYDRVMGYAKQQAFLRTKDGKPLDDAQVKKEVMDQLIGGELLYQETQKAGIRIDPKTVDERLAQFKKRFSNDADYKASLKTMNLSENQIKSDIERSLAIEKFVLDKFMDKVSVPEKEIKEYYESHAHLFNQPEQVRASHILIKVDSKATESEQAEALKKIKAVQEKQKKGEDFAQLAKTYSEGPSSSKGGDIGYFIRGQMAPPFEEAAFKMKPGEVSDVVKTRFGYHLIKVTDKKPATKVTYEDMKERIAQFLKREKVQKEVKEFVDKLRKDAKVEILLKDDNKS
jgi:peptidyl-prolyl cis-trans isomerase C